MPGVSNDLNTRGPLSFHAQIQLEFAPIPKSCGLAVMRRGGGVSSISAVPSLFVGYHGR
jgi:hypothetical protein